MNIYVNGFNAAAKKDQTEFILSFSQMTPVFDEDGEIGSEKRETVGSFVMSFDCAMNLSSEIHRIISKNRNKSGNE